jgi:hypothetical protein
MIAIFTKYDQIQKDAVSGTCITLWEDEKCIRSFSRGGRHLNNIGVQQIHLFQIWSVKLGNCENGDGTTNKKRELERRCYYQFIT